MAANLDLPNVSVAELVSEFEKAIPVLLSAAQVVEKFDVFLPGNVKTTVDEAVKILTAIQAIVSKL